MNTAKPQGVLCPSRLRSGNGQTLVLFAVALPVLFALLAFVVDGANVMVHRRQLQNAADATALAAAQDLNPSDGTCGASCLAALDDYRAKNGAVSSLHACNDPSPSDRTDTNCYEAPYVDKNGHTHVGQIEVRLTNPVTTFFADAVGLASTFNVSARAVATESPLTVVTPGSSSTSTRIGTTDPGSVSTSTTTTGAEGGVAFTLSSDCNGAAATTTTPAGASIQWGGAQSTLKTLATNGGISVSGNADKHSDHIQLGKYGVTACRDFFGSSTPNPANFPDVRDLPGAPIPYPVPPPSPAPPAGCTSLGPTNADFIIDSPWLTAHPNGGTYCLKGSTALLTISDNGGKFTGYTFFAPRIAVASSNATFTNAPPAAGQPATVFDAFGNDATARVGRVTLDACSQAAPTNCAFSMTGQGISVTGDIFVPNGTVNLSGGSGSSGIGGQGFIESLKLFVSGNFANFNGVGPSVGGTTSTTTTTIPGFTDPGTTVTTTTPGTTSTTGTTIGLGE
jgi:Flp pilus assembly protein TadG